MKYNLRAVGYRYNPPFTQLTPYCWSMDCPKPGSGVEYLKLTLSAMNSSATIIQFDGFITETLQMIANGSADITLMAIRQTLDRMELVQFTNSVGFLYQGYLVKELPNMEVYDYIVSAYTRCAFFMIIFFAILCGILLYLYTLPFKCSNWNMFHWLGQSLRALLNQSYMRPSHPISAMILAASWLFFCFVLLTQYQSKLQSFLSVTIRKGVPFNTMEGVIHAVRREGYKMVIQDEGYTPFLFCNPHQCTELNQLKNKIVYIRKAESLSGKIASGKFIGFTAQEESFNVATYDKKRHVLFVKDHNLEPVILAYAIRKNIPGLQEAFNRALSTTYGGRANVQNQYASLNEYQQRLTDRGEKKPLHIYHMSSILQFLPDLWVVSMVIFVLELILRRWFEEKILNYWRKLKKSDKITRIQGILPHRKTFAPQNPKVCMESTGGGVCPNLLDNWMSYHTAVAMKSIFARQNKIIRFNIRNWKFSPVEIFFRRFLSPYIEAVPTCANLKSDLTDNSPLLCNISYLLG